MGGPARRVPPVKYHYSYRFLTNPVRRGGGPPAGSRFWRQALRGPRGSRGRDPLRGQWQVGSLTGAVHLSNRNAGVLRRAQGGQKPPVEQKGKSSLDLDFQYEYGPRKRGLTILLAFWVLSRRCQKSYHRDNWLVAAKRS